MSVQHFIFVYVCVYDVCLAYVCLGYMCLWDICGGEVPICIFLEYMYAEYLECVTLVWVCLCVWSVCFVGRDWWLNCKVSRCIPTVLSWYSLNVYPWGFFFLLYHSVSQLRNPSVFYLGKYRLSSQDDSRSHRGLMIGVHTFTASPFSVHGLIWLFAVPWVFMMGKHVWFGISR